MANMQHVSLPGIKTLTHEVCGQPFTGDGKCQCPANNNKRQSPRLPQFKGEFSMRPEVQHPPAPNGSSVLSQNDIGSFKRLRVSTNVDGCHASSVSSVSSPSSTLRESDWTPSSSRESSVSSSQRPTSRRTLGPERRNSRPRRKDSAAEAACPECRSFNCSIKEHRRHGKNEKERDSRENLGSLLRSIEELLDNYGNGRLLGSKIQSASNSRTSGLHHCKIDVLKIARALLVLYLQRDYESAIENDHEEGFFDMLSKVVSRDAGMEDPWTGTLMQSDDKKCKPSDDFHRCKIHNQENWAKCRSTRATANFKRNRALLVARKRRPCYSVGDKRSNRA
ncbi:hypothetical protein LTR37_002298 [Vermiconidia calcicola]|uniref:Uncharacterized protein n=1 Tax=Vermiconidia calcicola TaxID=1690605 RepID=A0ACC3NU53_9PEZI|nr:hypothetical protein LTR37_002298 [Vermiconidia calcicola]